MTYIASGAFWGNFNYFVYSALGLLASILFARLLTKETYGMYQYILSIAGLVGAVTLTGMNSAVTRAVARGHEGEFKKATQYQILFGIIPGIIALIISGWYLINGNNSLALSFVWVALFLPLGNAFNTWAAYTGGKKLFRVGTYYGLLNSLISYTGVIALVYFSRDFVWIAFANFFFGFLGNIIMYKLILKNIPPNETTDPETIPYGKHLSLMSIPAMIAAQVDALLVFHFIGPAGLAIYSFATLIPEKLSGALKFISNIALPKFSEMTEDEMRESVFKKISWVFLIVLLAGGIYAYIAPYFFKIFFPAYTDSIIYTQIYSLSLFSIVATLLQTALTSQKKTKELYVFNFSMPFVKILLLIGFMYYFKVWGVIWAQIVIPFISIPLLLFLLRKKSPPDSIVKPN
ncbi:MAG: hypothetical protein RLZZ67_172 [Candidatus Parcubacteria bacterium]|jgi:O-antigen/teichoic acid export membrane protein